MPTQAILGGAPDLPGLVFTIGEMPRIGPSGWSHSRMLMYPMIHNFYAQVSFPGEGLAAVPFLLLFGWPAGFTLFTVAALAAFGAVTGLFAASWWRSLPAGLAAAFAATSSSVVVREVSEGRLTHIVGYVFAPIAVGLWCRAIVEDRGRFSFAAGAALGAAALMFWYEAVWIGFLLLVLFAGGALERLPVLRHTLWGAAGTWIVAGFPMLYTIVHAGSHPGSDLGPWSDVEEQPGRTLPLIDLLDRRSFVHFGAYSGSWGVRPLLFALCLVPLWGTRARRIAAPLVWILIAWFLAAGPVWHLGKLDVISPYLAQLYVPVLRRYWWPDRYLLLGTMGVAVLVGGAAWYIVERIRSRARAAAVLVACGAVMLVEAYLSLRTLPMKYEELIPDEDVEVLTRETGPLLVIPCWSLDETFTEHVWTGTSRLGQVQHRRPLLPGMMNPEADVASPLYRDYWSDGVLRWLRDCEIGGEAPAERPESERVASLARLWRAGLREIYQDTRLEGTAERSAEWRACVADIIGTPDRSDGPYRIFTLHPPGAIPPVGEGVAPAEDDGPAAPG